jgi:hypothetical protein
MDYNKRTLKTVLGMAFCVVALLAVCFLIIISRGKPPRAVYPSGLFDVKIAITPSGTSGTQILRPVIQGKIPETFALSWPKGLGVGEPDEVIVRIASNDFEDLVRELSAFGREVFTDHWKGRAELEVTLVGDSSFDITPRHSDQQVIEKGKPHKEWSWGVLPKATGTHELTVRVYGVHGNLHEDYDPEGKRYDVAFNLLYWASNSIQQNLLNWVLGGLAGMIFTLFAQWLLKRGKQPN